MKVFKDIQEIKEFCTGKDCGFVPTMGYLHEGHISLIKKAREQCNFVIVSIYVNPTQFGPNEDLESYPRDLSRDKNICEVNGVDALFIPDNMYPKEFKTYVYVDVITKVMCGKSRPNHFRGVTTIVCKLLNIINPSKAYLGQKDFQQSVVIKRMLNDLDMDTEIVVCPIIREKDGVAMSSRNKYLSEKEREQARSLNKSLFIAKEMIDTGEVSVRVLRQKIIDNISKNNLADIDYVEIRDRELNSLEKVVKGNSVIAVAVRFGKARLIDNILV